MAVLAVYLRLSHEDDSDKDESNSITNQRLLLHDYIHNTPSLSHYQMKEYCDDGYSGTSFNRPGITKLLAEVKENKIQCVLVKDMSRFSRDYIELGMYLNQIFPFMGIRFISVNDKYDSETNKESTIEMDTAFKTLLYDLYSKDLSEKVKASFANKCANGEYVFGQVPLGYEKNAKVKNAVQINEKEASIVRQIFQLSADGNSTVKIAQILYENEVPTVTQLRHLERISMDRITTWSSSMVLKILNNRFYLGEMAYGKTKRAAVGSKKAVAVPKSEWKVIKNHHEPLISVELFEKASVKRIDNSTKRKGKKHPLVGKVICGGCGYALSYKPMNQANRPHNFQCRKHAQLKIDDCCTYILADILEEMVLLRLNDVLKQMGDIYKQREAVREFQENAMGILRERLKENDLQGKRLLASRDQAYEDYAYGKLSADKYKDEIVKLDKRIVGANERSKKLSYRLTQLENEYEQEMQDMKKVIMNAHLDVLSQEVVDTFIMKICVFSKNRIEIEWNFSDGFCEGGVM